ncbi:hypothetical protein [Streptomyces sp. NPDC003710]
MTTVALATATTGTLALDTGPGRVTSLVVATLTPASLGGLRDATGLRAAELQQMQLDRYAGTVLDLSGVDLGGRRR